MLVHSEHFKLSREKAKKQLLETGDKENERLTVRDIEVAPKYRKNPPLYLLIISYKVASSMIDQTNVPVHANIGRFSDG